MPESNYKVLLIKFPLVSIADHIEKFEKLFHSLYYLLLQEKEPNNFLSCEIVTIKNKINFYLTLANSEAEAAMNIIFGLFPEIDVYKKENFINIESISSHALGYNISMLENEMFSLRTYKQSSPHDPLSAFLNMLATVPAQNSIFYQIVFKPAGEEMASENSGLFYAETKRSSESVDQPKVSASMRLLYFFAEGKKNEALAKMEDIRRSFDLYSTEKNKLLFKLVENTQNIVSDFFHRKINNDLILTREELASLYHIPDPALRMPAIDWILSKRAQPPFNLPNPYTTNPNDATFFGLTNFRGIQTKFGILREDRRRHLYVVGKSGVGKSKLLETLIINDIKQGKGVCVMDPHGDLIQDLIQYVPQHKVKDIVYFNVSDYEHPIAFNPLENVSIDMKQQVTQGLIEVFKKFFGGDWSPKIEHVFRYTTLAMLDYPNSTIVAMMKMLTNRKFRQKVIPEIKDSVVKHFWANEFSSWSEKFDNEAILPLVNKLGQFLSNHLIRNIVVQPNNTFDFDDIMNNQKILFIELSKGRLGEENSALLGAMLITKIYQTAMARAKLPEAQRKEFYLYIDEFQNFATDTFENILSESRKYRLLLTISHQYLAQVPDRVKGTVFGNMGSIIAMRVGADDGAYLANEFTPIFSTEDFINLGVREMLIKMSVGGQTSPPFSATTIDVPPPPKPNFAQEIIKYNHDKYTKKLSEIDAIMAQVYSDEENTNPISKQEENFDAPIV